jgi:hypothetical protein
LAADGAVYSYAGNDATLDYQPAGVCPSVAQIWAYQLLPGVTAGQMLTDLWLARNNGLTLPEYLALKD